MKPEGITKVPLNVNGHLVSREPMTEISAFVYDIGGEKVTQPMVSELFVSCGMCGEYPKYDVSKEGVKLSGPCADVRGITTTITLDVPSGKIVVDDDLRPLFNGFDRENFADYNSARGQAQVIEAFAEDKCAFGPVGNSCPDLWRTGEDTYIIARKPWAAPGDDWADEGDVPPPEGAEKLAGICTDLWAYSIADYDEWIRRGGVMVGNYKKHLGKVVHEPEQWTTTIVEIPAGSYEFTHHSGELDFDDDADDVVWCDIRKVA